MLENKACYPFAQFPRSLCQINRTGRLHPNGFHSRFSCQWNRGSI